MGKTADVLGRSSLIGGSVGLLAVAGGFVSLRLVQQSMEPGSPMPPEAMAMAIAGSIIILFLYHILSVVTMIAHQKLTRRFRGLRAFAAAWGMLSTILLITNLVLLQDIGNQFEAGMASAGEWFMVNLNFSIHSSYIVLSLVVVSLTNRALRREADGITITKNEALFVSVNYVGIFSGSMGLLFVFLVMISSVASPPTIAQIVPVFSIIILLPYLVVLAVWGVERLLERSLWDDEKQQSDARRGALLASVISLPAMGVLYLVQLSSTAAPVLPVSWLPILVFLYIVSFSAAVLKSWLPGT
jgi:hypothetical protein